MVGTAHYATARDPAVFHEPPEFKPERWLSATFVMRSMSKPFGHGRRICTGNHLAEIEIFCIIGRIFQPFNVSVDPDMPEEKILEVDRGAS